MPIYNRTSNRLCISVEVLVDIDMLHVQNSLRPVGGCGCSTDFGPTASDQYRERIKPRPREPSGRPVIEINISIIVRQRDALSKELPRGRPPYCTPPASILNGTNSTPPADYLAVTSFLFQSRSNALSAHCCRNLCGLIELFHLRCKRGFRVSEQALELQTFVRFKIAHVS